MFVELPLIYDWDNLPRSRAVAAVEPLLLSSIADGPASPPPRPGPLAQALVLELRAAALDRLGQFNAAAECHRAAQIKRAEAEAV